MRIQQKLFCAKMKGTVVILMVALIQLFPAAGAHATQSNDFNRNVEALVTQPDRDLAAIKLAVDGMLDPSVDVGKEAAKIDEMSKRLADMIPPGASEADKLQYLRQFLYEAGPWNDNRPFEYDLSDPLGTHPDNRKLSQYLATRRGNCITMPMLMMFLGSRIGLNMTLAQAPLHVFIKYTDASGTTWNLEATSGGGAARDLWYRQKLPMSDTAVSRGTYLRALTREETVALIASPVVDHLISAGEFEQAVAVSDVLLRHYPTFAYVLAKRGTAYGGLLKREVIDKYRRSADIPPDLRARADDWYRQNLASFARAEALGWRPEDGNP
ncbi:hypothetical protein ASD00_36520 [Ensifer sp. Root31]|nr:hypothetical protein ASD00_36520 [Ensifer sp. Root31]